LKIRDLDEGDAVSLHVALLNCDFAEHVGLCRSGQLAALDGELEGVRLLSDFRIERLSRSKRGNACNEEGHIDHPSRFASAFTPSDVVMSISSPGAMPGAMPRVEGPTVPTVADDG
jgi:hypothetical protein